MDGWAVTLAGEEDLDVEEEAELELGKAPMLDLGTELAGVGLGE